MKKIFTIGIAIGCLLSLCACQATTSQQYSETTAFTTKEVKKGIGTLQNQMSEQEQKHVSVGALTLLGQNTADASSSEQPVVEVELWDNLDYLNWMEEHQEQFSEQDYQKQVDFYQSNSFTSIHGALIDGRYYTGFLPSYGYTGGALDYSSDTGETIHADTFEAFQPMYRDYLDQQVKTGELTQEEADQTYADMLVLFQSVMDGTYEVLEEPIETTSTGEDFKDKWEFDADAVAAIADSVQEISMYDEELDTTFIIHVTLPPDFDAEKTYPMFVMTDGVWRFGDHPALWNLMQEKAVEDVILVSIGYDFQLDGTDNAVRATYFCEKKDLFLSFITDNLMPYLNASYSIDFSQSALYGHSLGGTFTHYAAFQSDLFENQPFQYYIIGSPAFWSPYFLESESNPPEYQTEYGYFNRNTSFNKTLYVCGGEQEDADYASYYGENDSTLEGITHLMGRLKADGVTTAECKIYADSNHYAYIPEMFQTFFLQFYRHA